MMEKWITGFPAQLDDALAIGEAAQLRHRSFRPSDILVAGLGGSGIGADIIRSLLKGKLQIPFMINQDYQLPGHVKASSLVIVSSFSGNTEESLSMMEEAISRGAEVAAVSSGGRVGEICTKEGINCIAVPPGQPPRTCLGYSMTEQLYLLHHYDQIDDSFKAEFKKGADFLRQEQEQIKKEANAIAEQLSGSIPVLYCGSQWEGVTKRFRQQLNENAKMLCWHHALPEMTHNELVGWESAKQVLAVVFLRSNLDHPRTAKRIELTQQIVKSKIKTVIEINAKGESQWQQALYLIHMGDWISFYLSEIKQVDPIEIDLIDRLKSELAKIV